MKKGLIFHLASRECGIDNVRSFRSLYGTAHLKNAISIAEDKAAVASKVKACCQAASSKATFLIVFNKDGCKMASLHGDHTIKVTDVATGRHLQTLCGHPRTPWAAAFHPASNDILATGCLAGEVRIWDLTSGSCDVWRTPTGSEIASLTFHPTEKILVIASGHNLFCWIWDIETGPSLLSNTVRNLEKIRWVKFDPSGEHLFTGITNSTLLEFRTSDANRTSESWSALREPPVRSELLEQRQRRRQEAEENDDDDGSSVPGQHIQQLRRHLYMLSRGSAEAAAQPDQPMAVGGSASTSELPGVPHSLSSLMSQSGQSNSRPSQAARPSAVSARRLSFDEDAYESSDSEVNENYTVSQSAVPSSRVQRLGSSAGRSSFASSRQQLEQPSAGPSRSPPPSGGRTPFVLPPDIYDQASGVARLAQLHNRRLGTVIHTSAVALFGELEAAANARTNARTNSGTVGTGSGLRLLRQQILAATQAAATQAAATQAASGNTSVGRTTTSRVAAADRASRVASGVPRATPGSSQTSTAARCCSYCVRSLARQGGTVPSASGSGRRLPSRGARGGAERAGVDGLADVSSQVASDSGQCAFCGLQAAVSQQLSGAANQQLQQPSAPAASFATVAHQQQQLRRLQAAREPGSGGVYPGGAQAPGVPGSPPPWSAEGGAAGLLLADLRNRVYALGRNTTAASASQPTVGDVHVSGRGPSAAAAAAALPGVLPYHYTAQPNLPNAGLSAATEGHPTSFSQQRSDITAHLQELNNDLSLHQQTLQYHQERLNLIRERQQALLENLNRLQQLHDRRGSGAGSPGLLSSFATPSASSQPPQSDVGRPPSIAGPGLSQQPLPGSSAQRPQTPGVAPRLLPTPSGTGGVLSEQHGAQPYGPDIGLLRQRTEELRQRISSRRPGDVVVLPGSVLGVSAAPQRPLASASGLSGLSMAASFLPEDVATAAFFSRTDYDVVQAAINRVLADAYRGRGEAAMASNIMNMSQRIQRWRFPDGIPSVLDEESNIVIRNSKIHNDISVDISRDGSLLAAFLPSMQNSHRGFPEDMKLGVFSLRPDTWGHCLYTKRFGPNAISVSVSPCNHYVLVGLAAKRLVPNISSWQLVAQAFKLSKELGGDESMEHVHDVMHRCSHEATRGYVSVNCALWLPHPGQGLAYGTNHGDLHMCLPGFLEPSDDEADDSSDDLDPPFRHRLRSRNGASRNSAASSYDSASSHRQLQLPAGAQRRQQSTGTQTVERSLL